MGKHKKGRAKNRRKINDGISTVAHDDQSVDKLLSQADTAMNGAEMDRAIELFGVAAGVLRSMIIEEDRGNGEVLSGNGQRLTNGNGNDRKRRLLLAKVLGRSGEAKASIGDLEGGKADFSAGIDLLEAKLEAFDTIGVDDVKLKGQQSKVEPPADTDSQTPKVEGKDDVRCGASEGLDEVHDVLASLHLYLGQVCFGEEAFESYRKGILHLESSLRIHLRRRKQLLNPNNEEKGAVAMVTDEDESEADEVVKEVRKQICEAYCNVAELFLTDLCFVPDAEVQCENALRKALENDSDDSPDALQSVANLRLSQSRLDEATESMMKAWARMEVGCSELAALVGLGPVDDARIENKQDQEDLKAREILHLKEVQSLPGFEFRCQSAKILLECSSGLSAQDPPLDEKANACAEASIRVLGSLLAENDEMVEVWHLLGCAGAAFSPPNASMAIYYWEHAIEMLTRLKKEIGEELDGYIHGEVNHTVRQIEDIRRKIERMKATNKEN